MTLSDPCPCALHSPWVWEGSVARMKCYFYGRKDFVDDIKMYNLCGGLKVGKLCQVGLA